MKKTILVVLSSFFFLITSAQIQRTYNWVFDGVKTDGSPHQQLTFKQDGTLDLQFVPNMLSYNANGGGTISNLCGELVFSCDGEYLYDSLGNKLPSNTNPTRVTNWHIANGRQNGLIVPDPNDPDQYYVFAWGRRELYYTLVDDVGNIIKPLDSLYSKNNNPNVTGISMAMAVTANANKDGYWLISHYGDENPRRNNHEFWVWEITGNGISPISVQDKMDNFSAGFHWWSSIKFSPQGDKIAFSSFGSEILEVFEFDKTTGTIGNTLVAKTFPNTNGYGLEFSLDGQLVYFVNKQPVGVLEGNVNQIEIATGNVNVLASNVVDLGGSNLQLAPDSNIYMKIHYNSGSWLQRIENINAFGGAIYDNSVMQMNQTVYGLPGFVSSFFTWGGPPSDVMADFDISDTSFCPPLNVELTNNGPDVWYVTYDWYFSNGDTILNAFEPDYTYGLDSLGMYDLTLIATDTNFCRRKDVQEVELYSGVDVNILDDTVTIIPGTGINIPTEYYGNVNWIDWEPDAYLSGSSALSPYLQPDSSKWFFVEVGNGSCTDSDSVFVELICELHVPTAFTPDGDNVNDYWEINCMYGMDQASVVIFNRWGNEVYTSEGGADYQPWDGNGSTVGSYYYVLLMDEQEDLKGIVSLIK